MRRSAPLMIFLVCLSVLLGAGCSTGPQAADPVEESADPAVVWAEHRIADPELAEQAAYTLRKPEGWEAEGGLSWSMPELYHMPVILDVRVVGPEGRATRVYPQLCFSFGKEFDGRYQALQPTHAGTLYLPVPEDLGQWLADLARSHPAPGVSEVKLLKQAELTAATQRFQALRRLHFDSARQANRMFENVGLEKPLRQGYDARASLIALVYQRDGRAIREDVVIFYEGWWMSEGDDVVAGGWQITGMISAAGPGGPNNESPLNDPDLLAIASSAQPTTYWIDKMAEFRHQLRRLDSHRPLPPRLPIDTEPAKREAREAQTQWHDLTMAAWREASECKFDDPPFITDPDAVFDPQADRPDQSDWQPLAPAE